MWGFSSWEGTNEGDTFVWAQSRTARLTLDVDPEGRDLLVRFRAMPMRFPEAPPQTLTLFVNDAKTGSVTLEDGMRVHAVLTPGAAWRRGTNELRLEFAYAEAPKDRIPGGTDTRTLAAAFDWLEAVPVSPSRPK